MKRSLLILPALALVVLIAAPIFASGGGEKKVKTIAFMPGVADPFYYTMEKGVRAKPKSSA